MKHEEKQLLFKDLCARLPYGIIVSIYCPTITEESKKLDIPLVSIDLLDNTCTVGDSYGKTSGLRMFSRKGELLCKPYLRPMSSMTEEERNEYFDIKMQECERVALVEVHRPEAISIVLDWLNAHHFDYRGLIEKSLALEAKEEMYKTE